MPWLTIPEALKTKNRKLKVNHEQPILSLETEVVNLLKRTYDPEIPVNIYDLGLIYDIETDENNKVRITMTLTAPNCPVADILPVEIKEKIQSIEGVTDVEINLVFDPPWDQSMMSEEALLELGML
jgi:FeS assembly SUF system protein